MLWVASAQQGGAYPGGWVYPEGGVHPGGWGPSPRVGSTDVGVVGGPGYGVEGL